MDHDGEIASEVATTAAATEKKLEKPKSYKIPKKGVVASLVVAKHVLKNQRRQRFKEMRNKNKKPVSPTLPEKLNFKLGHRLMAFEEKRKKTI